MAVVESIDITPVAMLSAIPVGNPLALKLEGLLLAVKLKLVAVPKIELAATALVITGKPPVVPYNVKSLAVLPA